MGKTIKDLRLRLDLSHRLNRLGSNPYTNIGIFASLLGRVAEFIQRKTHIGSLPVIDSFLDGKCDSGELVKELEGMLAEPPFDKAEVAASALARAYYLRGDERGLGRLCENKPFPTVLFSDGQLHYELSRDGKPERQPEHLRRAYYRFREGLMDGPGNHDYFICVLSVGMLEAEADDNGIGLGLRLFDNLERQKCAVSVTDQLMLYLAKGQALRFAGVSKSNLGRDGEANDHYAEALDIFGLITNLVTNTGTGRSDFGNYIASSAAYNAAIVSELYFNEDARLKHVLDRLDEALRFERKNCLSCLPGDFARDAADTAQGGYFKSLADIAEFQKGTNRYRLPRVVIVSQGDNTGVSRQIEQGLSRDYLCYHVVSGREPFVDYIPLVVNTKKAHGVLFVTTRADEAVPLIRDINGYGLSSMVMVCGLDRAGEIVTRINMGSFPSVRYFNIEKTPGEAARREVGVTIQPK